MSSVIYSQHDQPTEHLLRRRYFLGRGVAVVGKPCLEGCTCKRHVRTPETLQKISEANRGKKRSAEVRQRMSETYRGRKHSAETRVKMSETRRGRKKTLQHKQKLSEAHKRLAANHQRYKDGRHDHPHYDRWYNMMHRCYVPTDPGFKNYGGRGIIVCDEWHDPWTFFNYLDDVLGIRQQHDSIDRINNDGNYEPENVRWATRSQQASNKRKRASK